MPPFHITYLETCHNPVAYIVAQCESLDVLENSFAQPIPKDVNKLEMPMWCPALFRDNYRRRTNVLEVGLLCFDGDEAPVPTAGELRAHLAGQDWLIHSSSSATAAAPRWRLVRALSRTVTADEYSRLWAMVAAQLPFKVGAAAKDPSRGWFMPREGPDGYYECFRIPGTPLDVDAMLGSTVTRPVALAPTTARVADDYPERVARAAQLLGLTWPAKGEGRHAAQLALAGALCGMNWSFQATLDFLCTVCGIAGDEDRPKRMTTVRTTYEKRERDAPMVGWNTLREYVGTEVVDTVLKLLTRNDIEELERELKAAAAANEPPPAPPEGLDFRGLPRFPLHVLPTVLREFAESVAEFMQVRDDATAMLALAACAAAVAGKVDLEVQTGYVEPLNLYVLIALGSGERKSPVFEAAFKPLREREHARMEEHGLASKKALGKRELLEGMLKRKRAEYMALAPEDREVERSHSACKPGGLALEREMDKLTEQLESLTVPAIPRLLVDDVTIERLGSMLAEQHGRLCLAADEATILGIAAGRYAKDSKDSFELLLKAYSGTPIAIDRQPQADRPRPAVIVKYPRLTLAVATQPASLTTFARDKAMREKGLFARFLFALPKSLVGSRKIRTEPVPPHVLAEYNAMVRRLLDVPGPEQPQTGDALDARLAALAGSIPTIKLSKRALRKHLDFRAELEPRVHPETGDLASIADWVSKLAGNVARIAGVLHCVAHGPHGEVSEETMDAAIEIGRYLLPHAQVVFDGACTTEPQQDALELYQWMNRKELTKVTLRELRRLAPRKLRGDRRRLLIALQELIDLGVATPTSEKEWAIVLEKK